MARRRVRAREAGVCITCFKVRPERERLICRECRSAATARTNRRRAKKREFAQPAAIAASHERRGDEAYARHLYADAAACYREAVNVAGAAPDMQLRITEKLAKALALGADPAAAKTLLERVLAVHRENSIESAKTVEILLQQARQVFAESGMPEAFPLAAQALQIAKLLGDARLCKLAGVRIASYLYGLARYEEAHEHLAATRLDCEDGDRPARSMYHMVKGNLCAAYGEAAEAFDHYERAVRLAEDEGDLYHLGRVWIGYASVALSLGDIGLSDSCCERALALAQRYDLTLLLPDMNLSHADVLMRAGRYDVALERLRDALARGVQAPFLVGAALAEFGIPLALHVNDERTLTECVRPHAIELAFRSEMPTTIAPVAAAFAQLYASRGRFRAARELLHRALRAVNRLTQRIDFPVAVARYGSRRDVPSARRLLERLVVLPNSNVAQAQLALFDAYVARRNGDVPAMRRGAADAAARYDRLGWHGYAATARAPETAPDPITVEKFVALPSNR